MLAGENTRRSLELQAIGVNIRNEESKRDSAFMMKMLERFNKKDSEEEFIAKKKNIESHRSELGNEVADAKIAKITKQYLDDE